MADIETTSSQSNCQPLGRSSNDDRVPNCPHKVIKLTKSDLQTARTSTKGNDQSLIPVQTNLHRLIQNKLKRKKVLASNSNPSLDEIENRKKKSKTVDLQKTDDCDRTDSSPGDVQEGKDEEKIATKPPLPPRTDKMASPNLIRPPPIRLKRKLGEQNTSLVQKLNAQAEQLRLEVTELKTALTNERNAVRALRAQNEAEGRKSKAEIKKLQVALDLSKKAAFTGVVSIGQKKSSRDDGISTKDCGASGGAELGRMTNEILALKEANRILEEKIQMHTEAERRRNSDIRELKDSYEIRLTQISKSAKTEINRLLEEIKSKERNIGQLKKEMQSLKCSTMNKRDTNNNNNSNNNNGTTTRNAQHPPEMRKLKDIERTNSTSTTNQKCINTTCGDSDFNTVPHEITERILEAHNDLHIFAAKDTHSSDTDSALSSAPQSISPQPPPSGIEPADIWQSVKGYSKELESLQKINEEVQKENDQLQMELKSAKEQILDLEKTALVVETHNSNKMQHFIERIRYLEQREDNLIKESHELREQNELLEFRILELEESHDKWSLKSNSTPDTRDMWTDTEKDPDDILMYTDRSDSGITSPHSHHHIYDRNDASSPCDLSLLDQVSNDEVKRRITAMTKIPNIDEEDKVCLLQVLNLINNLETLSQDSLMVNDEMMSLEMVKSKASDYSSSASSSPRTLLTEVQPSQKGKKIIATVLPYSSTLSTPSDSPRRFRSWNSSSLQESGVFEGDSSDSFYSQATQTEAEDFPCTDAPATGDLCAEIQKLNKFREKIEEVVTKQSTKVPVSVLSPNLSDQRRLQFYKDRLELLENKILIYESSGDLQTKRLAERLQREIHLEGLAKELRQRVESLEAENLRLEEEKCEFEEAENDTRLRLQRLEVDLEILNQRNIELEMSREACQSKLKDAKNQCANLQETVLQNKEKMKKVEGEKKSLSTALGMIKASMPAIALFGALMVHGGEQPTDISYTCCTCHDQQINPFTVQENITPRSTSLRDAAAMQDQLHKLMDREKELTQNINELNRAYQETMENADILWAQIEKDYKDKLTRAADVEQCLKMKIGQLENRLNSDSSCAQERIIQLEENETMMKHKITLLTKHNKEIVAEHEALVADYQFVKDEMSKLRKYIDGPGQDMIEREKKKCRELEDDLKSMNRMVCDMEEQHKKEVQMIRLQLCKASKDLENIEVTNSELKEEVHTLENQICELQKQRQKDEEKIQCLQEEIKAKEENAPKPCTCAEGGPGASLAQEMYPDLADPGDTTGKFVNFEGVNNLKQASRKLAEALSNIRHCDNCGDHTKDIQKMAYDVKNFSDNIRTTLGDQVSEDEEEEEEKDKDKDKDKDNDKDEDKDKDKEEEEEEKKEKTEKVEKLNGDEGGDDDQGGEGGAAAKEEKESDDAEGGDEKAEKAKENAPAEDASPDKEIKEDDPGEAEGAAVEALAILTSRHVAIEQLKQRAINLARGILDSPRTFSRKIKMEKVPCKLSSIEAKKIPCKQKLPRKVSSIEMKKLSRKVSSIEVKKIPRKVSSSEKKKMPSKEKPAIAGSSAATTVEDSNRQFSSIIQKLLDAFKSTDHDLSTPPHSSRSSPGMKSTQNSARQDINSNRHGLIVPTLNICDLEDELELTARLKESEGSESAKSLPILLTPASERYFRISEESSERLIAAQNLCYEQQPEDMPIKSPQPEATKKKSKKSSRLNTLLELIRSSVVESADLSNSEKNLKNLYKENKLFKKNLKLALRFRNTTSVKCYDEVVRAMACLKTIEDIYKPINIPALKNLEEIVNASLLEYYKQTPAPKLYCTVFYPESRTDDNP